MVVHSGWQGGRLPVHKPHTYLHTYTRARARAHTHPHTHTQVVARRQKKEAEAEERRRAKAASEEERRLQLAKKREMEKVVKAARSDLFRANRKRRQQAHDRCVCACERACTLAPMYGCGWVCACMHARVPTIGR